MNTWSRPPSVAPAAPVPPSPTDAFARDVAAMGGRVVSAWGDVGVLAAAETRGLRHVFGAAPVAGAEHHVLVPFSLRSAVILAQDGPGATWFAGADEALAGWLRSQPAIAAASSRLAWSASLVPGAPPLRLTWAVQLRPTGAGAAGHLAMRVGDYGGATGLVELFALVDALFAALGGAAPEPHAPRAPLAPSLFGDAASRTLGFPLPSTPPPKMEATFVPAGGGAMSLRQASRFVDVIASSVPSVGSPDAASREDERRRRVNEAGRAFLRGKTDEFIAIWESIQRDLPDVGRPGEALQSIGAGYDAKKDYARAIHHYELALRAGYADVAELQQDIAKARAKMR
jgi:hypothetical protein